jgi:hypothetical protein
MFHTKKQEWPKRRGAANTAAPGDSNRRIRPGAPAGRRGAPAVRRFPAFFAVFAGPAAFLAAPVVGVKSAG